MVEDGEKVCKKELDKPEAPYNAPIGACNAQNKMKEKKRLRYFKNAKHSFKTCASGPLR